MIMLSRRTLLRTAGAAVSVTAASPAIADARPSLSVVKTPTCGCCGAWAELADGAGYAVAVTDVDDIAETKVAAGVPDALWSCHTAELRGPGGRRYAIEGHVPFEAMDRLLAEAPDVAGLAVPGMPMGSPGMGNDPAARYDVIAWGGSAKDGTVFFRAGL